MFATKVAMNQKLVFRLYGPLNGGLREANIMLAVAAQAPAKAATDATEIVDR